MTTEAPTTTRDDLSSLNMNALRKKIKAERFASGESAWTPELEAIDDLNALREAHRAWRAERTVPTRVSNIPQGGDLIGAPSYAHEHEKGDQPTPANDSIELTVLPMTQLGRECYVARWPYTLLDCITFDPDEQRKLDKKRLPAIESYIRGEDGFFGSVILTAVGDNGDVTVYIDDETGIATLSIAPGARVLGGEGQHRIEGAKRAMENAEFAAEHAEDSIPAVIYTNLKRDERRQLFADVNLHAKKPSRALALHYDGRNFIGEFTKRVIAKSVFNGHVDFDRQKLGKKDTAWFTFSAMVDAISAMFDDLTPANADERLRDAVEFWSLANDALALHWEAKNYATNKNALVAVAKLRGFNVSWRKVRELDWALDGEVHRIAVAAGGTNAAVPALVRYLTEEVVEEA